MNSTTCCTVIPLSPPPLQRIRWTFTQWAVAAGDIVLECWRAYRARRQEMRELAQLMELSPHALQDIGAPDWLCSDVAAYRAAEQLRWDHARAGLGFRTGPW